MAPTSLQAQVVGDRTLPVPSDVTFSNNTFIINGGTTNGKNLFHSFDRFDLLSDTLTAFFNNTSKVENIIARVTGGSRSQIYGQIRAEGNANLFLINPYGIIFGPNATLNIGGSFIGSTAESILFDNGGEFSATNPQAPPLLTLNVPIGLHFRLDMGDVLVQGLGHNLIEKDTTFPLIDRSSSSGGLRVSSGKTLALIGGNVKLEGSTLTAEEGHVEVGSVGSGLVSLGQTSSGWKFGYDGVSSFKDIELSQLAAADVSGSRGGSIQLQGNSIKVADGSILLVQTEGDESGGDLIINASKSFEVVGFSPDSMAATTVLNQTVGEGNGGNLVISTQRVLTRDGGIITTRSLNYGSGGNIFLNASESVDLVGSSNNTSSQFTSFITSVTQGPGKAGDINISTKSLKIQDGGALVSAGINLTSLDGGETLIRIPNPGLVGDVTVNATESVQVIGGLQGRLLTSSLGSQTYGSGNAGKLTINTKILEVRDGGRIDVATFASGMAGDITINASKSVEVSGSFPGFINPSQIISSANILDAGARAFFFLPDKPSGNSGSVTINTPQLSITDDAQVTVRNDGTGSAGKLVINANSILLDNKGGITASTASGEGGNIKLNLGDSLQLRNDGFISATAAGTGNGGNIVINGKFLIAFPSIGSNGSDIIANAFSGSGGNISIKAQGVFGIAERTAIPGNRTNDIDASSEFGRSGQVQINTTTDPSQGLIELPSTVVDPNSLVAQNPCSRGTSSEFTLTGRGGLPSSSSQDLSSKSTLVGLVEPTTAPINISKYKQAPKVSSSAPLLSSQIVPARGWVYNGKGEVVLVAYSAAIAGSQRLPTAPPGCPVL